MRHLALLVSCAAAIWAADYPVKELTAEEKEAIDRALPTKAPAKPRKVRKVLLVHITKRNGNVVRGHPSISYGNYAFVQMGKRTGAYEATINNEEAAFRPENLKTYDLILFNNTLGILFDDPALRQSLLEFVKNGKGFAGIHGGGGATFVQHPVYDQFPEFGVMAGGYEDGGHPWLPKDVTHVKIDDPKSPLTAMFKGPFQVSEETYQFREPTLRDRLHVLISVDVSKMEMNPPRRILKQRQADMDFPLSWIKPYGKGRVFYTATGHDPAIFREPAMLQHYLAGIQFALGDLKADMTPSQKK
ncbi:MAG: ThuA domain-containing protein [Bryobacteraceae bacterium]